MLEEKFKVQYSEIGADGSIPLWKVLNRFQEAAGDDAKSMNFGNGDFDTNLVWILTRMQMFCGKKAAAKEELNFKTWHCFSDKLTSRREFTFKNAAGEPVVTGASWWLLMNLDTRKITRMPQRLIDMNGAIDGPMFEEGDFKMPAFEGVLPVATMPVIVRAEDIDSNRHVNNTHFTAWAIESAPLHGKGELKELRISFKNECFEKDKITVNVYAVNEESFWHVLVREADNKEVARVYTAWQK